MKRLLVLGPFLSLGLVLVVLWALVAWFSIIYPRSLIRDVQEDLHNTAEHVAGETEGMLREAESNLRALDLMLMSRRSMDDSRDATVSLLADTVRDTSHGVTDVMLANTDGRLWRLPSGDEPFVQLGKDSFLRELGTPGSPSVVISPPLSLRPGGRQVLPLSTRLSVRTANYNAAVAFIDLEGLLRVYKARLQRQTMAIFLERDDGIALARTPEVDGLLGRNITGGAPQRPLPSSAPGQGEFELSSALDGKARIVAYQTLRGYPLRIFVSLEEDHILGGYLAQRRVVIAFSLLVSMSAIGLMIWLTRVQQQARLAEAEREATADASAMGLFRSDLDGRTVYANDAYFQLLEVDRESLTWGWLERVPEAHRESARTEWLAGVRAGEPMNRLRHMVRRDGTDLVLSVRIRPMRVGGRIVAFAGTALDVTEAARQQEAARMLGAIIDSSPDYIAQSSLDGRILYLNPAVRARMDMAPDAPLDELRHHQFFTDEDVVRYDNEILPAAKRDGHWHGRWQVRTRSGVPMPVYCTLILHRGPDDEWRTASWILRDISVEIAAERERERNQVVMSAVAHSSSVEMLAMDTEERVLFCNKTLEQRLAIPHRAWEGQTVSELLGELRYADIRPLIRRVMEGESTVVELRDDPVDERDAPRYLEFSGAPLQGEHGDMLGAYVVGRDVTDSKQEQIRLLKASNTDPLTELLNRAGFAANIDTALHRARDRGELVALLYLDLDRFKPVNDQYGHPVGDALLKAVAGRLRHALRPQDVVGRLGGDEFAVFLHHVAKPDDVQVVAEKLVHTLTMPFRIGALELHIGTSVGYCVQWARQVEVDALVTQADAQLYHAKRAGRGQARGSVCAGDLDPAPLADAANSVTAATAVKPAA